MSEQVKPTNLEKFMKLEESKRDRIINAAMKEFSYGYKKASTDAIVKEAGISKGLLYHYFVSKEQLYTFLIRFATDLLKRDYYDILAQNQQDILEGFWQMALLKKDITAQHPHLYDFINGLYAHVADIPNGEIMAQLEDEEQMYEEFYEQCDAGLFRDDIDHRKAIDIISYTIDNLFDDEEGKAISAGEWEGDSYERFLDTLRGYLDIFRTCFYKKEDS